MAEASAGDSRFRAALETMLDSVVITTAVRDEEGRVVDFVVDYINPVAEIGQRPAEEMVGRRFRDVWPSITGSPIWEMYLRLVETGEPVVLDDFSYSDVIGGLAVTAVFDIRATRLGDGFLQNFRDVTQRYQVQQDLAASEKRFRTAIDALMDPFFILSPVRDGRGKIVELEYRYANQAAERLYQMPRQDIVGHGQLELFPSVRELGIWDTYLGVIATGNPARIDVPYFDEHGIAGAFELAATPGEEGLIVAARDVSAARRAQEALRASEKRAREDDSRLFQFLDAVPVGVFISGPDGRPYFANQEAQRLLGRRIVPDAAAEDVAEVYQVYRAGTDELYPAEETVTVRAFGGEPTHVADQEVRQPDGTVIPLEVWGRPVCGADAQIEYAVCVFADMSERSARERIIADQAALLDLAHDAIFVRDTGGRITFWSAGAEKTYGFPRAEATGRTSHELLRTTFPETLTAIEAAVARDGHWEGELTQRRRDGRSIVTASRWAVQRGPDGSLQGYMEVNRDITARKDAELRMRRQAEEIQSLNATLEQQVQQRTMHLLRSNQELEHFGYSVAHDLRAPLRAINGYCQILLDEHALQLDEAGQELLGNVGRYALRMGDLIDGLLTLAGVGRADLARVRVDMTALAGSVAAGLRTGPAGACPAITVGPLADAAGDPELIRQVWENLIGNAVKFSAGRADARVSVDSQTAPGEVIYRVRDNGAGFDMAYAGKLFGAFQRLHGAEFPGTGIGLAIVARVVERHGGRVWAEGRPGGGACFSFALPAAPAEESEAS